MLEKDARKAMVARCKAATATYQEALTSIRDKYEAEMDALAARMSKKPQTVRNDFYVLASKPKKVTNPGRWPAFLHWKAQQVNQGKEVHI